MKPDPRKAIYKAFQDHCKNEETAGPLIRSARAFRELAKETPEKRERYFRRSIDFLERAKKSSDMNIRTQRNIDWYIASVYESIFQNHEKAAYYAEMALGEENDSQIYDFLGSVYEKMDDYETARNWKQLAELPVLRYGKRFPFLKPITNREIERTDLEFLTRELTGNTKRAI